MKKTWKWDYPEGMTLGDLRSFAHQCDGFPDDSPVKVQIKIGGKVKMITVEEEL